MVFSIEPQKNATNSIYKKITPEMFSKEYLEFIASKIIGENVTDEYIAIIREAIARLNSRDIKYLYLHHQQYIDACDTNEERTVISIENIYWTINTLSNKVVSIQKNNHSLGMNGPDVTLWERLGNEVADNDISLKIKSVDEKQIGISNNSRGVYDDKLVEVASRTFSEIGQRATLQKRDIPKTIEDIKNDLEEIKKNYKKAIIAIRGKRNISTEKSGIIGKLYPEIFEFYPDSSKRPIVSSYADIHIGKVSVKGIDD